MKIKNYRPKRKGRKIMLKKEIENPWNIKTIKYYGLRGKKRAQQNGNNIKNEIKRIGSAHGKGEKKPESWIAWTADAQKK
jgi:hypothetical protein